MTARNPKQTLDSVGSNSTCLLVLVEPENLDFVTDLSETSSVGVSTEIKSNTSLVHNWLIHKGIHTEWVHCNKFKPRRMSTNTT